MDKDPIMIYDDFCIVRENGKYYYESDDDEFEVVLLAREPYDREAEDEDLILLYDADVTGEEDSSGDYLYFVEARTFTFRTEYAVRAAVLLQKPSRGRIRCLNDKDVRHRDIIIIDGLPVNETDLKQIMKILDNLGEDEMDEYPGDFLEAVQEDYKYIARVQYTQNNGEKYWEYTFFNSYELKNKFLGQHYGRR